MSFSSEITDESAPNNKQNKVKHLYDQIESIKSTICMTNGERPELWIQRQNLQDLYHQIILTDIDFTIDKKLEQDLWNLVFKSQINYFQTLLKENRGTGSGAGQNKLSLNILPQKRLEAQASLFFFLEAARGFYTKLLEDIVLIYDFNEIVRNTSDNYKLTGSNFLLPFCQRFPSIFDKINNSDYSIVIESGKEKGRLKSDKGVNKISMTVIANEVSSKTKKLAKEKQVLYICQHILTHLGDIARYANIYRSANLFEQAKNYYLHAIKLVPYLGHPYNQLGILFETSRINQLSTIFYYVRSVACRYNFPLASTNMENFFKKIVDIPLTRYNSSLNNPNSINNLLNNNESQLNLVVKLTHKDLVTLYLQINAIIYFMSKSINKLPGSTDMNSQRVSLYLELFKSSFMAFITTPLQLVKLDSMQFSQMITILIFLVSQTTSDKATQPTSFDTESNDLRSLANVYSINLFAYLVEKLVYLFNEGEQDELVMPSLYIAFNFIENHKYLGLINDNRLWTMNKKNESNQYKFVNSMVKLLNTLYEHSNSDMESLLKYSDYPLSEDRLLDSFLPFKDIHSGLNFSKYMRNRIQPLNSFDEDLLRKKRIVSCAQRILQSENHDENKCFINLSHINEYELFKVNLNRCKPPSEDGLKILSINTPETISIETKESELSHASITKSEVSIDHKDEENISGSNLKQPGQQRKRRQVVAINSLTHNRMNQEKLEPSKVPVNTLTELDIVKNKQNMNLIQPNMIQKQQQQQHILANTQMHQGAMSNQMQNRNMMHQMKNSYGASHMLQHKNMNNQPLLNDPVMFQNNLNNPMTNPNNMMLNNNVMNPSLMRQNIPQSQQMQTSFFPSASQRQFPQPEMNRNFNQLPMNFPKPMNDNYTNFIGTDMSQMNMRPNLAPNMSGNLNYNQQNIHMNNFMSNKTDNNFNLQLNKGPNMNPNANMNNQQVNNFSMNINEQNNSVNFHQNQQMYMQKFQKINYKNQMQQQQDNLNFQNFQNQQPKHARDNSRLVTPQQFQTSESMQYKNINENAVKTDLIDRLASSKSFNNIWTNENESNKNSKMNSNSLPVENLIKNNPATNSQNVWSNLQKMQQQQISVSANMPPQNFINSQIDQIFNAGTNEPSSNSTNDGILSNILQQLNTNFFPDQNPGSSQANSENPNLVDLATISLPNTPNEQGETKQNINENSSIWSFSQQKNRLQHK